MAFSKFITKLKDSLSAGARVITDPTEKDFQLAQLRWSDVDVKVPSAIVQAADEQDIVTAVKTASLHQIPFVPVSGGHSLWSTIGTGGFILDITKYKSVEVDAVAHRATVTGGVLMKEFGTALEKEGECAPLGNGNTIGVIGYCLGGGIGVATGLMGFACDNILSARVVLADGRLLVVDDVHHPDLFWAIKGAGYYFGVVTQITLKTYPLAILGTPEGQHWSGNFVYPVERAAEVFEVVDSMIQESKSRTAGLLTILAPPPHFKPVIAVGAHYFGDLKAGPSLFQELTDLGPIMTNEKTPHFQNLNDHLDFACGKGGLRRFDLTGLHEFKVENFMKAIDLFHELLTSCPDAAKSGYFVEWTGPPPADIPTHSAFGHQDIRIWLHCLSWCEEEKNVSKVFECATRAIQTMRLGSEPDTYVDVPHGTRTNPIEHRFPEPDKLAKLRALKLEYDPHGVMTRELL